MMVHTTAMEFCLPSFILAKADVTNLSAISYNSDHPQCPLVNLELRFFSFNDTSLLI